MKFFINYYKVYLLIIVTFCANSVIADWNMWRHNSSHTAETDETLPASLHLQWERDLGTPAPAWPFTQSKLRFDLSYEPVATDKLIFVPSSVQDNVVAYDTSSGEKIWDFITEGPIRFAPVIYKEKLLFGSDDGYLYCLNKKSGKLIYKKLLGPSKKKILGNERMISIWPVRGAPVLHDKKIYVSAGIWPFMGIFIYCLDADTGKTIWCNSGSGSKYIKQQHYSPAFAGVAPQGYMTISNDILLVPGGRTVPAAYNRHTGEFLYYHLSSRDFGKSTGGYSIYAQGEYFFNGGKMFFANDGKSVSPNSVEIVTKDKTFTVYKSKFIKAQKLQPGKKDKSAKYFSSVRLWKSKIPNSDGKLFFKAGNSLIFGDPKGNILSFNLNNRPESSNKTWEPNCKAKIKGTPWSMIATGKKLFIITTQGVLYCFGEEKISPKNYSLNKKITTEKDLSNTPLKGTIGKIIKLLPDKSGYCVTIGIKSEQWINTLLNKTNMQILVIEANKAKISEFRKKYIDKDVYGKRITISNIKISNLPPYFASLVIDGKSGKQIKKASKEIFRILRPFGGIAYFSSKKGEEKKLKSAIDSLNLPQAKTTTWKGGLIALKRVGSLPNSASWTHQYADANNSVTSKDKLVKLPLGILWFGGASNELILPRHGHGPTPQVVEGRIIIEGPNMLRALDVYTGRLLWEKEIKDLGKFYNHTNHHPGANSIGSNYVSMKDAIYAITPKECLIIDPQTGKTVKKITIPSNNGQNWGFIAATDKYLITATTPIKIDLRKKESSTPTSKSHSFFKLPGVTLNADYATASKTITVFDRKTTKPLWSKDAKLNFRHNAIIAGNGKLFCIDSVSAQKLKFLKKRGYIAEETPTIYALDLKDGKELWSNSKNVFGTWLGYSLEHNALIETGSDARDRAKDESKSNIAVYNGSTGKLLWRKDYRTAGPCMIHKDRILTQAAGYELLTGKRLLMKNPITEIETPWTFKRNYGCNTAIASENILTFRSAAAGYFDLNTCVGTGNLGGFKSGCTSNLIVADGVLNAPDYTKTCTCSYQNQSSISLIHTPGLDSWTFTPFKDINKIKQLGLNFGAPGDQLSEDKTLWLEYPIVGGPSPKIPITISPRRHYKIFHQHSSKISNGELKWVAASGIKGVEKIKITLPQLKKCDIRMVFSEPDFSKKGERVFSVSINEKNVLENFDILSVTKQRNKSLIKTFKDITPDNGKITISFKPSKGKAIISGIELINN